MIEGDMEVMYEDEDVIVYRIFWKVGEHHGEKWITKNKHELEDEED